MVIGWFIPQEMNSINLMEYAWIISCMAMSNNSLSIHVAVYTISFYTFDKAMHQYANYIFVEERSRELYQFQFSLCYMCTCVFTHSKSSMKCSHICTMTRVFHMKL